MNTPLKTSLFFIAVFALLFSGMLMAGGAGVPLPQMPGSGNTQLGGGSQGSQRIQIATGGNTPQANQPPSQPLGRDVISKVRNPNDAPLKPIIVSFNPTTDDTTAYQVTKIIVLEHNLNAFNPVPLNIETDPRLKKSIDVGDLFAFMYRHSSTDATNDQKLAEQFQKFKKLTTAQSTDPNALVLIYDGNGWKEAKTKTGGLNYPEDFQKSSKAFPFFTVPTDPIPQNPYSTHVYYPSVGWAFTYPDQAMIIAGIAPIVYDEASFNTLANAWALEKNNNQLPSDAIDTPPQGPINAEDVGSYLFNKIDKTHGQNANVIYQHVSQDQTPLYPLPGYASKITWSGFGKTNGKETNPPAPNGDYQMVLHVIPYKTSADGETTTIDRSRDEPFYSMPFHVAASRQLGHVGQYLLKKGEKFYFQDYFFTVKSIGADGSPQLLVQEIHNDRSQPTVPITLGNNFDPTNGGIIQPGTIYPETPELRNKYGIRFMISSLGSNLNRDLLANTLKPKNQISNALSTDKDQYVILTAVEKNNVALTGNRPNPNDLNNLGSNIPTGDITKLNVRQCDNSKAKPYEVTGQLCFDIALKGGSSVDINVLYDQNDPRTDNAQVDITSKLTHLKEYMQPATNSFNPSITQSSVQNLQQNTPFVIDLESDQQKTGYYQVYVQVPGEQSTRYGMAQIIVLPNTILKKYQELRNRFIKLSNLQTTLLKLTGDNAQPIQQYYRELSNINMALTADHSQLEIDLKIPYSDSLISQHLADYERDLNEYERVINLMSPAKLKMLVSTSSGNGPLPGTITGDTCVGNIQAQIKTYYGTVLNQIPFSLSVNYDEGRCAFDCHGNPTIPETLMSSRDTRFDSILKTAYLNSGPKCGPSTVCCLVQHNTNSIDVPNAVDLLTRCRAASANGLVESTVCQNVDQYCTFHPDIAHPASCGLVANLDTSIAQQVQNYCKTNSQRTKSDCVNSFDLQMTTGVGQHFPFGTCGYTAATGTCDVDLH